jgi:hypothetical protein
MLSAGERGASEAVARCNTRAPLTATALGRLPARLWPAWQCVQLWGTGQVWHSSEACGVARLMCSSLRLPDFCCTSCPHVTSMYVQRAQVLRITPACMQMHPCSCTPSVPQASLDHPFANGGGADLPVLDRISRSQGIAAPAVKDDILCAALYSAMVHWTGNGRATDQVRCSNGRCSWPPLPQWFRRHVPNDCERGSESKLHVTSLTPAVQIRGPGSLEAQALCMVPTSVMRIAKCICATS